MSPSRHKKASSQPLDRASPAQLWNLDQPLLNFSPHDTWTLRDACEGVQILGGIGSGKTSGSGKAIARSYLQRGLGGIILCAKPEELDLWLRYCKQAGRSADVIVFNPQEPWRYNFIDAELRRGAASGGGLTENLVELLMTVTALTEGAKGMDGGDKFWDRSMKVLLRNAIDLITLVHEGVNTTAVNKAKLLLQKGRDCAGLIYAGMY